MGNTYTPLMGDSSRDKLLGIFSFFTSYPEPMESAARSAEEPPKGADTDEGSGLETH